MSNLSNVVGFLCGRNSKMPEFLPDDQIAAMLGNVDEKAEMEAELLKVQQDLTALITSIQTKYEQLEGSITNNTSEIENAIKENKEELKKAIEEKNAELEKAINNNISDLEERVAANEAAISNLQKSLEKLENYVYDKIRPLLNKTARNSNCRMRPLCGHRIR